MEKRPKEVLELEQKLKEKGIWFNITNNYLNQEASTCLDASQKRVRLGHHEIPIFSELKSRFGSYVKDNIKKYLLVHCRGNQKLDAKKIAEVIGAEFQRIDDENELKTFSGTGKGLVNPFLGFDRTDILQIFDESLFTQEYIPYTMMTNASHRRWGVEFKTKELIDCLNNILSKDVILDSTKFSIPKHKIGILTGNSPESGILLWEKINESIREKLGKDHFLGDISLPEVVVESIPEMGLSMELDLRYDIVSEIVRKGVANLCEGGATILCVACNTTQYFSEMLKGICSENNATFLSIPETTHQYLKNRRINRFDFLGINYVSDFKKWSAFKNLNKEFDLHLPQEEDIKRIIDLAFEVKKRGMVSGSGVRELCMLIDNSTITDTVIFALTELSIIYKLHSSTIKRKTKKEYLDTLAILAEAIGNECTKDYLSVIERSKEI